MARTSPAFRQRPRKRTLKSIPCRQTQHRERASCNSQRQKFSRMSFSFLSSASCFIQPSLASHSERRRGPGGVFCSLQLRESTISRLEKCRQLLTGILFHSFHQLFEGLALGARIASVPRQASSILKRMTLAMCFVLITPLGIAIGVGARTSFNPNDRSTLLAMGTLQSISAGALLWSVLVELIAADYIYGPMARASFGRAVAGVTSLLVGALLMSVLAQWA